MAYSFQTFSYLQVFTSVQANQLEENILKHEHGVTANCQVLSLYATLSENETVTGQWTFSNSVGIGITPPTAKIQVVISEGEGTAYPYVGKFINNDTTSGESNGIIIYAGATSSDVSFEVDNRAGSPILKIKGDGYVGIGIAAPSLKLHVRASGEDNIRWDNASYTLGQCGYISSANRGWIGLYDTGIKKVDISGNGQISLSPGTGVKPLILGVNDSTVCDYLSADMVDGLHATDFLRSNMSVVRAKRITSSDSFPDATLTTIIYNGEDFDSNNEHETTTGIFTATNAGYYAISAGANISSGNIITYRAITILKNSTIIAAKGDYDSVPASTSNDMNISAMIYLGAADTLKVQVTQTSGTTGSINNSERTFMSIHRIK